jgi:hypothetical protein
MTQRRKVLLLLLAIAACSDTSTGSAPAVTSFEVAHATLTEETRIDGMTADLVRIGALAVAPEGSVAITQPQDRVVRYFGPGGEVLGQVGREGQGPGEFTGMGRMGWVHDTLWVFDPSQQRLTLISPERAFVRTVSNLPDAVRPMTADAGRFPEFPNAYLYGVRPDWSLWMLAGLDVNQVVPEPFRGRLSMVQASLEGEILDMILQLPPDEAANLGTAGGESAGLPFGNRPGFAVAADSRLAAYAMASLEGEDAGTFALSVFGATGAEAFTRRYEFDAEPIPTAVADSTLDALASRMTSPDLADAIRRSPVPRFYSPITELLIGIDGTLWVQMRDTAEGRPYYVAAADGTPLGTLLVPRNTRIGAAERNRIWAIVRDDLGVESLVTYFVAWTDG